MIENEDYRKFCNKELTIKNQKFKLEFDKERRCFRLYQSRQNGIGVTDIDHGIQAHLAADLGSQHYFEKISQTLPHHSYVLLDATTFEELLTTNKIRGLAIDERELSNLSTKEKAEEQDLKDHHLSKEDVHRRVWLDKEGRYKTCINNEREIFVTTEDGNSAQTMEAFRLYLSNQAFLRRKEQQAVPIPFLSTLKFQLIDAPSGPHRGEEASEAAAAVTGSKLPLEANYESQAFVIFPIFLTALKNGVQGLRAEIHEIGNEIDLLEKEINACQSAIETYKNKEAAERTEEDALACFKAMQQLKESMHKLPQAKMELFSRKGLAYPGIISIFSAVACYQIESTLNMLGVMNDQFGKLAVGNYDSMARQGFLGVTGNGFMIGGETIMICFAMVKILGEAKEIHKNRQEMSAVGQSDEMSELAKKVIISLKKDENFFSLMKILGNGTLAAGQALTLSPVSYAGLAVSTAGAATATIAEVMKEKRHGFEEQEGKIEEEISDHYAKKMVSKIIELSQSDQATSEEAAEVEYSKIVRSKVFTNEIFFHLSSASLVIHKVLKEGAKHNDFEVALDKAETHYAGRAHQQHLLRLAKFIGFGGNILADLDEAFIMAKDAGEHAYQLFHEKVIDELELKPEDAEWIIKIGEKMSQYKLGDQHTEKDFELLEKISEIPNLPEEISQVFKIAFANKLQMTHEELMLNIQTAFIKNRLNNKKIFREILPAIRNKSEEERAKELNKSFLEGRAKMVFVVEAAQEEYIQQNRYKLKSAKERGEYESATNASPISIVGKIRKYGAGIFSTVNRKNVYKIDPEKFKDVSNNVVRKVFDTEKYWQRSNAMRALHQMVDTVTKDHTVSRDLAQAMGAPANSPNRPSAVQVFAHAEIHESHV